MCKETTSSSLKDAKIDGSLLVSSSSTDRTIEPFVQYTVFSFSPILTTAIPRQIHTYDNSKDDKY